MRRRLIKLAVFLLLGAIVNVAVAWECSNWSAANKRQGDVAFGFGVSERYENYAFVGAEIPTLKAFQAVETTIGWPQRCAIIDRPLFGKTELIPQSSL